MEALILLMVSVCLLSLYGLVYVSIRLVGDVRSNERTEFRNSLLIMLVLLLVSGTTAIFLIMT
ncbi:hypothetical protein N0O92_17555 [Alkalihalobacillus sp. MEB130]|uniref:hypothetical protein n=1 Tax=Alkalihalobacillus sp. MEB130 TaxID=2976704 RepID=UPI0028DEE906|nr:hypothetical protein [Alkalihalobacillus sp. MEB130]MDT8862019.1 hypothetical protein [Alkalihalobacillus sp. MEB130]